jgi:hypothetical protein
MASAQYGGASNAGSYYGNGGGQAYGNGQSYGQQNNTMQAISTGVSLLNMGIGYVSQYKMWKLAKEDPETYALLIAGQTAQAQAQNTNNSRTHYGGSSWLGSSDQTKSMYGSGNYPS